MNSSSDGSHKQAEEEFLSIISHELRTPLSITKWYTEMLIDGDCGELNEEQKKYLLTIENSTLRAIDLVRSILNVSRLSLGTFSVTPTTTNLSQVIKAVISSLDKERSRKGIIFEEVYRGAVPGMVADLEIDKQVATVLVRNLVKNSIMFSQEGKTIVISAMEHTQGENISGYALPEDSIVVSVKDSGIGIPSNDKEKIFSKFFRGSNVDEVGGGGSGLGLYMNQCILEKVGGNMWYESTPHTGSTFYLAFPKHGMQRKEGRVTLD